MRKLIRLGRAAGNVRHVVAAVRHQQHAEREQRELAEVARARQAAQGEAPVVPARRLFLAGALDQWLIWGSVLCFLGVAIMWFSGREEHSGWGTALALAPIFLAPAFWPVLLMWSQRRHDSTAGMFVLGLRYGPRRRTEHKASSLNHVAHYWEHLLRWRADPSATLNDAGQPGAVLVDRRTRTPAARLLRALVAVVLVALPVPLILAVANLVA